MSDPRVVDREHSVYSSPMWTRVGLRVGLHVSSELGANLVLSLDDLSVVAQGTFEPYRSTPTFQGARVFLRTIDRLWCLDASR